MECAAAKERGCLVISRGAGVSAPSAGAGAARGEPEAASTPELERRERHDRAVEELIETERGYLDDLRVIEELYRSPMASLPGVSGADMGDVFSNIASFTPLHSELLSSLLAPNADIGAIFCTYAAFFRIYVAYCSNLSKQDRTLKRLAAEQPTFAAFLEVCATSLLSFFFSFSPAGTLCTTETKEQPREQAARHLELSHQAVPAFAASLSPCFLSSAHA